MSYIQFENGRNYFFDRENKRNFLVDLVKSDVNRTAIHSHQFTDNFGVYYPLFEMVQKNVEKLNDGSLRSIVSGVIYFRIIDRLLKKPQIHKLLHVGEWTIFDEILHDILPRFNDENKIYCLSSKRPLEKFNNARFIFVEDEKYFLPENKFATVIFSEMKEPPPEIILSAKDSGNIYFVCETNQVSAEIKSHSKIYEFEGNIGLFELKTSREFKRKIFYKTEAGEVYNKKLKIWNLIKSIPAEVKKINSLRNEEQTAAVDELYEKIANSEKTLAEIFPYLVSEDAKYNLNMLKEFLADFRLRARSDLQEISAKNFAEQYIILKEDLKEDFLEFGYK